MKTVKVQKHFHKDFAIGKNYEVDDETASAWIESGLAAASNLEDLVGDLQDKLSSAESEDESSEEEQTEAVVRAVERAIVAKTSKLTYPPSIKVKDTDRSLGEYLQLKGRCAMAAHKGMHNEARTSYDILRNKYSVKTNMNEGTATAGGDLVPYDFVPMLLYGEGYDPIWRKCQIVNTSRDQIKIPVLDQTGSPANNFQSAFAGGVVVGFVNEATAPGSNTQPAFKQLTVNVLKALGVAQASNELLSDSAISVEQIITKQFALALNALFDGNVLNGNGSSQFTGIIGAGATISVARETALEFQLADAAGMISKLLPSSRGKACWIMSPSAYAQLLTFEDAAGRIVFWQNLNVVNAPAATLMGLPVYICEHSPVLGTAGDVLLIDPSSYVIPLRLDMQLMASIEYAFTSDLVTYRLVARANGISQYTAPVTLSNGTDTVSAFVQLGNASS